MSHTMSDRFRDIRTHPANLYRPLLFKYLHITNRTLTSKQLPEEIESLLILAQEKLGDAILFMPFLYALHNRFPKASIDIACTPRNISLFGQVPFLRDVVTFKGDTSALKEILAHRKYTLLYNPKDHPSFTFIQITRRVKATIKVCINHPEHNQFYHIHLSNHSGRNIVEKNASLLLEYNVRFPLLNRIPDSPKKNGIGDTLSENQNYIAINLSAGSDYRKWTADKWSALFRKLIENYLTHFILLFAMPEDRKMVECLQNQFGEHIRYCKTDTLLDVGDYLKHANLLISPDTAVVHIAAAKGVPVIGLYHNDERNATLFTPYGVPSKILLSDDLTLRSIDPEQVVTAVQQFL